jgi:hypothetical protein
MAIAALSGRRSPPSGWQGLALLPAQGDALGYRDFGRPVAAWSSAGFIRRNYFQRDSKLEHRSRPPHPTPRS